MSHSYQEQLRELGLSDKEASVYLASLRLGPSPVQKIAEKAEVKRATTYVAIQSLTDRGLMSSFNKGKKTLFTAEPPRNFVTLLEKERDLIERRQHVLKGILSDLISLSDSSESHPRVSFFDGIDGIKSIHEDILASNDKTLENIVALDEVMNIDRPREHVHSFRERLETKGIKIKILYSSKMGEIDLPAKLKKKWEVKRIDHSKNPIHGEITLYGNKTAAFSYHGKIYGAVIESREITQTLRTLFNIAWLTK